MKTKPQARALILIGIAAILAGCSSDVIQNLNSESPEMSVQEDTLDFENSGLWRSLIIYNTGGGSLNWSLTGKPNWIEASSLIGSISANALQAVALELDRGLLDPGTNQAVMSLNSNGGDLQITVLAQQELVAVLGQLPDTLDFGTTLDSLPLTIINAGGDTLIWGLAISDSLFSAVPGAGATMDQSTVWVYFDRENASAGNRLAVMQVSSNGGVEQIILKAFSTNQEGLWISYCTGADGYYGAQPNDYYFVIRFDRPPGWEDFRITRIRAQLYTLAGAFDEIQLHCWDVIESEGYLWPDVYDLRYQSAILNPVSGWNEWAVNWPLDLATFCVGYLETDSNSPIYPNPYYDSASPAARSYLLYTDYIGASVWDLLSEWDWCIEVFVEPLPTVGAWESPSGVWLKPSKEVSPTSIAEKRPTPLASLIQH